MTVVAPGFPSDLNGNPVPADPAPQTGTGGTSGAKQMLISYLSQYGLGDLAEWAWAKWQAGESFDQIKLELPQTAQYQARFPAMAELAKKGRAISTDQYVNYEQTVSSIFKAAGLPQGFYDRPDDFTQFLVNDIAPTELQTRVQAYQQAAFSSPPEVRAEMERLYGVTPGELTAFFIDPDKALPLIQQRFSAAQAGGFSQTTGFGLLTQNEAEKIGNMGLTEGQLAQQFGQAAALNGLYDPLVGSGETQIGKDVAIGAVFGQNAQDQQVLEARKQKRLAEFAAGGQVATTQQGAVGAGTAR